MTIDNWYEKVKGNIGVADKLIIVETDKQVYELLVKVLPWDGSINFIRKNNFAGFLFKLSSLDDLYEFEYQCSNPVFEFIDPDLESLRANLLTSIAKFTEIIGTETYSSHTAGVNSVPDEWISEQPERYENAVNSLHAMSDQIVQIYNSLVKTATRKLGILPLNMLQ
ncbi:MAG: hypothetical protein WC799_00860 [Desulfobacteraceae bacterium]